MTTHSTVTAWKIPRMEEPGGLQCMESQRVGHDLVTKHICVCVCVCVCVSVCVCVCVCVCMCVCVCV